MVPDRKPYCTRLADFGIMPPMKYWEIIADRLHAEGWSYGIAEHFTKHGFLFCVDVLAPRFTSAEPSWSGTAGGSAGAEAQVWHREMKVAHGRRGGY